MNDLDQLVQDAQADFSKAAAPADLENAKARYLGKSGRLTDLLKIQHPILQAPMAAIAGGTSTCDTSSEKLGTPSRRAW